MCMSGACGGQKIASVPLGLELKLWALGVERWSSGRVANGLDWKTVSAALETSLYHLLCHN